MDFPLFSLFFIINLTSVALLHLNFWSLSHAGYSKHLVGIIHPFSLAIPISAAAARLFGILLENE